MRTFDILSKVIGFSLVLQSLATTPLWSAYTEAYVRKDFIWIGRAFRKRMYLSLVVISVFTLVAVFIDPLIYLWMHIRLEYSLLLLAMIGFYYVEILICNVFCMLLNGIGDIDVQMWTWIISAVSVVPLTYYFACVVGLKLEGIALGMVLSLVWLDVILPIQTWKKFQKWKNDGLI